MSIQMENDLKIYEKPIFLNGLLLGVNLVLFIFKLVFSFYTNSLALQADAFDNLTDIIMVATSLFALIYVNKKPNEKFPYGYFRLENIVSLIISIFIFFTAYTIIQESIKDVIAFVNGFRKIIITNPLILILLSISLLISFFTALYIRIIGKRSQSPIIESEAKEKLMDNFISLTVIIGFIGAFFNLFILDSIFGILIAIFIIKGGYDIFLSSTKTLLDAVIDFDKRQELYNLIERFPKVKEIRTLEIRKYGRYVFIELDLLLGKGLALSNVDLLKKKLKNQIKKNFPEIFKITIITHTQEQKSSKNAVPLKDNNGLNSEVYDKYGEAPYFGIFEIKNGEIYKFEVYNNQFIDREKRKGILVSDWLSSQNIDKIYTKMPLKRGPKLVFENSFIEVVTSDEITLHEILRIEKDLTSR
ncbi:MAG: cation diffusion facilitator family transporter [Candidatus Lokiarchaeota archaeon]|nr:cation diffusion facilitator family transporter [Candidatus Lokiarchaeota archaeon]MBD3200373.1 cation diffusion facilitator family transporter [Candidatus Lokiarchaeota archaeon]